LNLTIKDVVQLFQEQAVLLVAGTPGIDNIVNSVNIMDAPDIWSWVKPGDLILTTAYTIKDDAALQEKLIRELAAAKCAGLGIKTKRFLPEIPEIMKKTADELCFPILELPLNLSLAEIMNPIVSSIATRQSYLLQRSIEIHKALTAVAVKGGGLDSIIQCLGMLTQCPVSCYDTNSQSLLSWFPEAIPGVKAEHLKELQLYARNPVEQNEIIQKNLLKTKTPYTQKIKISDTDYLSTSFPMMSSNNFFGYISIFQISEAFLDINCVALEQACTVATLEFMKQKAVAESRRLRSRDMIEHILFGDMSNPVTVGSIDASKLSQAKYLRCIVAELDNDQNEINIPVASSRLYKVIQQTVIQAYPLSLVSERTGQIIAILAANMPFNNQDQQIYDTLQKILHESEHGLKASIGIGTIASELPSIRQSYHDALMCLNLGRKTKGTGKITYPHEVASYSILSHKESAETLTKVCGSIISKLEHADRIHGADLLKTLASYLECDKNLTETAKELFIHRNTLSNRLERITDVTGIDYANRELLFCVRLALRLRLVQ
jgi:PucR family transcriptional regulator, purine catabolism regulatory protein